MKNTVFKNDPFAIIADVFEGLYPDKQYIASLGYPDGKCEEAYGMTVFVDGKIPQVVLFANVQYDILPEIFAHELSHVAVGESHGHDAVWEDAFTAINDAYLSVTKQMSRGDDSV